MFEQHFLTNWGLEIWSQMFWPNPWDHFTALLDNAWANALKKTNFPYIWIYIYICSARHLAHVRLSGMVPYDHFNLSNLFLFSSNVRNVLWSLQRSQAVFDKQVNFHIIGGITLPYQFFLFDMSQKRLHMHANMWEKRWPNFQDGVLKTSV